MTNKKNTLKNNLATIVAKTDDLTPKDFKLINDVHSNIEQHIKNHPIVDELGVLYVFNN